MKSQALYTEWLHHPLFDEATKAELRTIADQANEIEDRFYRYLEFGTGGMRGVLAAGTNRINRYTVRRATQGLANAIAKHGERAKEKGVVIAYDSRHQSSFLAGEAACTLAANGIRVYLFDNLRPTPELSFAVRHLEAQAGIVITASHNPPEYNGYKVYWEDGGQITSEIAQQIIGEIDSLQDWSHIAFLSFEEAKQTRLLTMIGPEVDTAYLDALQTVCLNPEQVQDLSDTFSIVYTPLHGAGYSLIPQILRKIGFSHVHVVPEQEQPDPDFSSVASPNPEEKEAFRLAIAHAEDKQADVVIATDPDCDRVGVAVRSKEGTYEHLTGNQIGALLLEYLLSERKKRHLLADGSTMITTIVSSELGSAIARKHGVDTIKTLTGFKYIAEQIRLFEANGDRSFAFGYEESYGFLASPIVREKDAVMASMLICEMAAFYQQQGKTLLEVLAGLHQEHGTFLEALESRTLKGKEGVEKIRTLMEDWRNHRPQRIGGQEIVQISDYLRQITFDAAGNHATPTGLPKENVLQYRLQDGSWFSLRPSGTEPKLKVYFSVRAASHSEAVRSLDAIKREVMSRIDAF